MFNILPLLLAAEAATGPAVNNISGSITLAIAGLGSAIAIGMIGTKAAEAVGRNPGAFGKVLTIAIIAMALAEAIAIYALIMAFGGY